MNQLYRVAIQYRNDNGFIEYDPVSKQLSIILEDAAKRCEVEQFLSKEQEINSPQHTIEDFTRKVLKPTASLENLKLALTGLWQKTGVHVDWSRPA